MRHQSISVITKIGSSYPVIILTYYFSSHLTFGTSTFKTHTHTHTHTVTVTSSINDTLVSIFRSQHRSPGSHSSHINLHPPPPPPLNQHIPISSLYTKLSSCICYTCEHVTQRGGRFHSQLNKCL